MINKTQTKVLYGLNLWVVFLYPLIYLLRKQKCPVSTIYYTTLYSLVQARTLLKRKRAENNFEVQVQTIWNLDWVKH